MRRIASLEGINLLSVYFKEKLQYNFKQTGLFEFGIDKRRFDLIIFDSNLMRIRGFEFKTNKTDFNKDIKTEKWKQYLKYCHTFTWVCPEGLIQKEEVESPTGLLWIRNERHENSSPFYLIKSKWIKKPKKNEIQREIFDKTICLLIGRVKTRKDDFF